MPRQCDSIFSRSLTAVSWHNAGRSDPCVTHNGTTHAIQGLGITWSPGQLAFHPGRDGEYAVVRWTAPAERLLRNMLNCAAKDIDKPMAELPATFPDQLKAIGY